MKWNRSQRLTQVDWGRVRVLKERSTLPGKAEYQKMLDVVKANPRLENRSNIEKLCAMAVSMKKGQLKTSTISTTLRKVIAHMRGTWSYKEVKRGLRLAEHLESEGQEGRQAAPTITRRRFKRLCDELDSIPMRACVELMGNSPMRFCDIRATTFERVSISAQFVEVKLQGGKTTKTRLAREKFRIEKHLLSKSTLEYLRGGRIHGPSHKLSSLTTSGFNDELKKRNWGVTSYSFRNMWIEEVILSHTSAQGLTNWSAVQQITLHRSVKALKSNYGYVFDRDITET